MHFECEDNEPSPVPDSEFYLRCKTSIKVCQKKLDSTEDAFSSFNPDKIDQRIQNLLQKRRHSESLSEREQVTQVQECFMLFVVHKLLNTVSESELQLLKQRLSRPTFPDRNFELAKVLVFEGNIKRANHYFYEALKTDNTQNRVLWWGVAQLKSQSFQSLEKVFCCFARQKLSKFSSLVLFETLSAFDSIEGLWGLMELSCAERPELELLVEAPEHYATKILEKEKYYGYLAWSHVYLYRLRWEASVGVLKDLINAYPHMPEAYMKLFELHYYHKQYEQAMDTAAQAFVKVTEHPNYFVILCLNYSKACCKLNKYEQALDLLLRKYQKHPNYQVFLYYYGKYSVKGKVQVEQGLQALQECLLRCHPKRLPVIQFWIAVGFFLVKDYIKAKLLLEEIKHLFKGKKLNKIQKTEKLILEELKYFTNKPK